MGGIVCAIPHKAILRFDEVPSDRRKITQFDAQLRRCFEQPQIVEGIDAAGHGYKACELLELRGWDDKHRNALLQMLKGLYPA